MPDTCITDLRHGIESLAPGSDAAASARRYWQQIARITLAATAWYVDTELKTTIRCRRRPQRRACKGQLRLSRRPDGEIHWECIACEDHGVIRGWEATAYDLSGAEEPASFCAIVTPELFGDLAKISDDLPRLARRVVVRGALEESGVLLMGSPAELDALKAVVSEAGVKARGQRRVRLAQLLEKLSVAGAEADQRQQVPEPGAEIAETLLAFAGPLLDGVGDAPDSVVDSVLGLAAMIWNSLVLEAWGRDESFLDQTRAELAKGLPRFIGMFETLVERKRQLFATDLRAIGNIDVNRGDDGELQVTAEAWLPETLRTVN